MSSTDGEAGLCARWRRQGLRVVGGVIAAATGTELRRRFLSGAGWAGVGTIASRGLVVLATVFLARRLGSVAFGEYGMLASTIGMASSLASGGMGLTVTQQLAQLRARDGLRAGRVVALAFLVAGAGALVNGALLVLLAPWLAGAALAAPHLAPWVALSALPVAFGVVFGVQTATLDGCEAFRQKALLVVASGTFQAAAVVVGGMLYGVGGALWGLTLGTAAACVVAQKSVSAAWARFGIAFELRGAWREWRILGGVSAPTFLLQATMVPVPWFINVLVANQPGGYAELGILSAATQWQGAVLAVAGVAGAAMVPVMAERIQVGGIAVGLRIMWKMTRALGVAGVVIGGILCAASPWIARAYGPGFEDAAWTIAAFVATGALGALMLPMSRLIVAAGRMWWALGVHVGWIVAILLLTWLLLGYGAVGVGVARLLAQAVYVALHLLLISRIARRGAILT